MVALLLFGILPLCYAATSPVVATAASSTITAAPSRTSAAVLAGSTPLPLTQYSYAYNDVPYQVNPFRYLRGPQTGYNICNSTTSGANSQCQTLIMNDITDFCLWGSPTPNSTIGDSEALVVAYCTKDTHGARTIPAGALTAVQFIRTSAYIQVIGRIDQTVLGLQSSDFGGELDPHGADLLGNPLGGLVYSNGLNGANGTYTQAQEWNNFVGGGVFCLKLCNVEGSKGGSLNFCENRYDLVGCNYNMPSSLYNNATNSFESCDGALQDVVGTYAGVNGVTSTWDQPQPSIPAGYVIPYTPRIPASSNCRTFQSTAIYGVAATPTATSGAAATGTGANASGSNASGSSRTGSTSNPTSTAARTGGAGRMVVTGSGLFFTALMAIIIL